MYIHKGVTSLGKNKIAFILFSLCLLALSACGSKENDGAKVLKKVFEAHNEVESVQVDSTEDWEGDKAEDEMLIDFANEEASIDMREQNESIHMSNTQLIYINADGSVDEYDASDEDVASIYDRVKNYDNPLVVYTKGEQKMHEIFELETKDDTYVMTFQGSDEDAQKIGNAFIYLEKTGLNDSEAVDDYIGDLSVEDMDVEELDVEIVIDRDTHLVQSVATKVSTEMEGAPYVISADRQFSEYNNVSIDSMEVDDMGDNVNPEGSDKTEADTNLDDDTKKTLEKEASAYVDALIQATVFQDEKGFKEKAPKSMDKKDVEEEAKTQKEFFKEIYRDNTKANMEGTGASDKDIDKLTDAFMEALGKTKYKMADAKATSGTQVVVTVSVEGIDDQAIYADTEKQLYEVIEKEQISDEAEAVSKNLEILAKNYENVDTLTNPTEVEVNVMYEGGKYVVLLQDEYLAGFVQ